MPDGQRIVSAFFGLDDGLPPNAAAFCPEAPGTDGLVVVLGLPLEAVDPTQFTVVTSVGQERTPRCATLSPATDPGESRSVLLTGDFGDAEDDPPERLLANLEGGESPALEAAVVPLEAGPSLVLAEAFPGSSNVDRSDARGCPDGTAQTIRVTWSGGVSLPGGGEAQPQDAGIYHVTVEAEGSPTDVQPTSLADLDDHDNHHELCLDTTDEVAQVRVEAGALVDPNGEVNGSTTVEPQPG